LAKPHTDFKEGPNITNSNRLSNRNFDCSLCQ